MDGILPEVFGEQPVTPAETEAYRLRAEVSEWKLRAELAELTLLAENGDVAAVANMLELPTEIVQFSLDCVGDRKRKGLTEVGKDSLPISHFAHMARVALMMKHYFPDDYFGRILGMLHDIKEEAKLGMENKYMELANVNDQRNLSYYIELLTEVRPTKEEIEAALQLTQDESEAIYIATYRKYIRQLHKHWDVIGPMELCDRLEGSNFGYLLDSDLTGEAFKRKALLSIARVWATISMSDHPVAEKIRKRCEAWFETFKITEQEVGQTAKLFLTYT